MTEVQTVVAGAGVIGIAIARRLARAGHEVLILEAEDRIAQHTSSRNSQVIHAGIYYTPGSMRARLCVRGKEMLYDYCVERHVPHENTQKLIVAVNEEHLAKLPALVETAHINGAKDLVEISAKDAIALEPELQCVGAVLSPSTGIVDAPAFILSLLGEAEAAGAFVALGSPVQHVDVTTDGFSLSVGDVDATHLKCRNFINAAGLGAWDIARAIRGAQVDVPEQHFAKGSWFSLSGAAPFERLIYPVPDDESLGVHYTRDLGGGFRFGPDLRYLEPPEIDYTVESEQAGLFEASVRRWWPAVPKGAMKPDGCGIRPRTARNPFNPSDFIISGPNQSGINGLVQLFGIESPGLTSSLAVAELVDELLRDATT